MKKCVLRHFERFSRRQVENDESALLHLSKSSGTRDPRNAGAYIGVQFPDCVFQSTLGRLKGRVRMLCPNSRTVVFYHITKERTMKCIVKDCQSMQARKHHNHIENRTYIIRVCDACKSALMGKQVCFRFYRCGGLVFVEEIEHPQ